jgi:hypothetical protein
MKNSNDTLGNRTREVPVCSPVTQPTMLGCIRLMETTWRENVSVPLFANIRFIFSSDRQTISHYIAVNLSDIIL